MHLLSLFALNLPLYEHKNVLRIIRGMQMFNYNQNEQQFSSQKAIPDDIMVAHTFEFSIYNRCGTLISGK